MLEAEIVKLREAVEALTAKLGELPTQQPVQEPVQEFVQEPVREAAITMQDVKDVTLAKSREGFAKEIRDTLSTFGVKKIQELDPSDYVKYLAALGEMN